MGLVIQLRFDFKSRLFDRARRGFTLVEILVACAVVAVLAIFLWQLISTGGRQMEFGTWYSSRIAEQRTGLRRLREDIGRATYPSVIEINQVIVTRTDPKYYISYRPSTDVTGATAQTLLTFYICSPEVKAPLPDPRPDVRIRCELIAEGRSIRYRKKAEVGAPPPSELYDLVLFRDVTKVVIAYDAATEIRADQKGVINITMTAEHPTYTGKEKKAVVETTAARVGVLLQTL